mgnify:FL=1
MGRQNVGTPKFYVDLIQYWHAKGVVAGIGPYGDTGDGIYGSTWYEDVCPEGVPTSSDGSGWSPELIGFNPYSYVHEVRGFNTSGAGGGYLNQIVVFKEKVLMPSNGTMFVSYLNHNLDYIKASPENHYVVKAYKTWNDWLDRVPDGLNDGYDDVHEVGSAVHGSSLNEICNFYNGEFEYNGFSIAEFDAGNLNGCNQEHSEIDSHFGVLYGEYTPAGAPGTDMIIWRIGSAFGEFESDGSGNRNDKPFVMGSFNLGQVYTMPHSPDLSLTMSREFDGINKQTTKGGATLTQINYDGPPKWRDNLGAWELHNTGTMTSTSLLQRQKMTRGRRVWNLKFSYLSSDDLFSPTELLTHQSGSLGPVYDGGYAEGDFEHEDSTAFDRNFNEDNSFMSIVMGKTMGGNLPFIFQPDSNNNSADQFAICELDQDSISFKQVANNVYDVSLKIREVW